MIEENLKRIYKEFLKFKKFYFFLDTLKYSSDLKNLKLSKEILNKFFNNYYKVSFLEFLGDVKRIIYSKNVFDFISQKGVDDWELWAYLKFLGKNRIIKIKETGKVILLKKEFKKVIFPPRSEREIKSKIEKKLETKIKEKDPVINLFGGFQELKVKSKWDQLPLSQESALFLAREILERLPLNKKFLLIGDDDFISVILTLVEPSLECLVIDVDDQLLECLNFLAKKFKLKIETKKIDIRERKKLKEKIIGFSTNPIYTDSGVKEFVRFGKEQLTKDGGIGFLVVGDEGIKNRFLFLQDFFQKNNLIIEEIVKNHIYYPYFPLYQEDKEILKRFLSLGIKKKVIRHSPRLGADLYIFRYLPFKPRKVKFKKPIYAYL